MMAVVRNSQSTGPRISNSLSFIWSNPLIQMSENSSGRSILEQREDTKDVILVDVHDHHDVDGLRAASCCEPVPGWTNGFGSASLSKRE
jgi:hypothetical protein